MAGLQMVCVVEIGDLDEVVGAVDTGAGGVVGVAQGVPGTSHWPAESKQLSTWPLGKRQSLAWELSQVPEN